MEVSSFREDISRVQRPESICAFGEPVSLSRFRERLAIATVANPVFVLPWRAAGTGRLDSGVRRLRGCRPGVTQRFVVDDAEPPRSRGWTWNARAHERGAFCGCCRLLSKTRAGDSSDTFE